MIEFQDFSEEGQILAKKITEKLKLILALANFYVDGENSLNAEVLTNQRAQLIKALKELEVDFQEFVALWRESQSGVHLHNTFEPAPVSRTELISKFIKMAVPAEMQSGWNDEDFSGSLLVFFENGKIESSSLIEKKLHHEVDGESVRLSVQEARNHTMNDKPVKVVLDPRDSFTVIKSPTNSKVRIYFTLKKPEKVIIKIYDQLDQIVRQFEKEYEAAGEYTVEWDGKNDQGLPVAKDHYYFQLQVGNNFSEIKSIEWT
ncbi:MAG: FlgD immunoglobulin-like domain containing protein [bacterium]